MGDKSNSTSSSPSLLGPGFLGKFKYQRKVSYSELAKPMKADDESSSSEDGDVVEESSEQVVEIGTVDIGTIEDRTNSDEQSQDDETPLVKPHHKRIRTFSTSEDEQNSIVATPTSASYDRTDGAGESASPSLHDTPKLLTNKDRVLRILMRKYVSLDAMEVQDCLARNNWDLGRTDLALQQKYNPGALAAPPSERFKYSYSRNTTTNTFSREEEPQSQQQQQQSSSSSPGMIALPAVGSRIQRTANVHKFKELNRQRLSATNGSSTFGSGRGSNMSNASGGKRKRSLQLHIADDDDDPDARHDRKQKIYQSSGSESDSDQSDDEDCPRGKRSKYDSPQVQQMRQTVVDFFNEGSVCELQCLRGCSKKKAELIVSLRPFSNWPELVQKLGTTKGLTKSLLNLAKDLLQTRGAVAKLMSQCEDISRGLQKEVDNLIRNQNSEQQLKQQPELLSSEQKLTPHQLVGLNWLCMLHRYNLNGILADEMGLGKTVQVIAFLAQLYQTNEKGPHVIVVPASTIENWQREFALWCPTLYVVVYHGPQEDRKELRLQIANGELVGFNVILTTYSMLISSAEDRGLFRRLQFEYAIYDEAHMLKNMASQRYQHLMKVNSQRKLMLTGTPLQNNLLELMSLLIFTMPKMFDKKEEQVKTLFSKGEKTEGEGETAFEKERIAQAKSIMRPFVLRRLKADVLAHLPTKHEQLIRCPMTTRQAELYRELTSKFRKEIKDRETERVTSTVAAKKFDDDTPEALMAAESGGKKTQNGGGTNNNGTSSSSGGEGGMMLMQLRKAANHPLLIRRLYTTDKLRRMAKLMLKEPTHKESNVDYVFEDMEVMSDFELHRLCSTYKSLNDYRLSNDDIVNSGKCVEMDRLIEHHKQLGHRILIFSQFTMVLDILEEYMHIRGRNYLRLDGSTPVTERQDLIDAFSNDKEILVFLLSTRACGLGINLTQANVVILHDIDFNPYNDKQAEDRCHRFGQQREVHVLKLVSERTVEEGIHQVALEKLKLEKDVTTVSEEKSENDEDKGTVLGLLRQALQFT